MVFDPLSQRQVNLGPAGFFRAEAEEPAGNQVRVIAGAAYRGAFSVEDQLAADQLTGGFASVSGAGLKRYDLVYVDQDAAVQVAQGAEVPTGNSAFDGAPGYNLGPPMPPGSPVCYVLVDETGTPTVDTTDIQLINGVFSLSRDLTGYLIDKGLFGSAPAGTTDDVSALFAGDTRITASIGGATVTEPDSGGSATQAGIVTSAPLNYVTLVDQVGDEIKHNTGARMGGRLTEAAGTWTLAYIYIDAAGAEQAMDPSADTDGAAPTDVRLVGVPRVYSEHDPSRPLFQSAVARLSDQVVGDIPTATTTVQGKGLKTNNPNTQPAVPEIGSLAEAQNNGSEIAGGPWHTLNFPAGGVTDGGSGVLNVNVLGPPGPTGPAGPSGVGNVSFTYANSTTSHGSGALGFTPLVAILLSSDLTQGSVVGAIAFITGSAAADQRHLVMNSFVPVYDVSTGVAATWTCTQFNSSGVNCSGTNTLDVMLLVFGG